MGTAGEEVEFLFVCVYVCALVCMCVYAYAHICLHMCVHVGVVEYAFHILRLCYKTLYELPIILYRFFFLDENDFNENRASFLLFLFFFSSKGRGFAL